MCYYTYELDEPDRSPSEHYYLNGRVTNHISSPERQNMGAGGITKKLLKLSGAPTLHATIQNNHRGPAFLFMQDPRTAAFMCKDSARIDTEVCLETGSLGSLIDIGSPKHEEFQPSRHDFEFSAFTHFTTSCFD